MLGKKFHSLPAETRRSIWNFSYCFKAKGYECFLIGGSCRDLLLGETPHDFDFATNCPLPVTKTLFPRVIPTGESHGTLSIPFGSHMFEVTRYRKDVATDGRHATIVFSDSIEEDQQRRDMRINSLAYDAIDERVVDSQGGLEDFAAKIVRFVGDAETRVLEDHLRAVRFVRMIAKLQPFGFGYDPNEMDRAVAVFDAGKLSLERVYEEIAKINRIGDRDKAFCAEILARLNIFAPYFAKATQARAVARSVMDTESLFPLYCEFRKTHSLKKTAAVLKLTRRRKRILDLLQRHSTDDLSRGTQAKRMLSQIAPADMEETAEAFSAVCGRNLKERFQRILSSKEPFRLSDLAISGNDLKKLGYAEKRLGEALRLLQEHVWKKPDDNLPKILRQLAKSYRSQAVCRN